MQSENEKSFWRHGMAKWGLFMGTLFALWFGGWFVFADYVEGRIETLMQESSGEGLELTCSDRRMIGFPFRIGLQCASTSVRAEGDAFTLEAGQLKTAAQIYDPSRLVAELASPFQTRAGAQSVSADWEKMRLFADLDFAGGFDLLSLTSDKFAIAAEALSLKAASGGVHMRPTPGDEVSLDFALNLKEFATSEPTSVLLPPANFALDVKLSGAYSGLFLLGKSFDEILREGLLVDLRSFVMGMDDGGRLALSGPLTIDSQGLLSGEIEVGIAGTAAVQAWFAKLDPQLEQLIGGMAQAVNGMGQETTIGSEKLKSVKITLDKGVAKLGFITLGQLPPVF